MLSGVQVSRSNWNSATDTPRTKYLPLVGLTPVRQQFVNNLDVLNSISLAVGGPMINPTGTLTIKLYDGCGTLVAQASSAITNGGITMDGQYKYVLVNFGAVALNYNKYYYFEPTITGGLAYVVANVDRYAWGRLHSQTQSGQVAYPEKKRDLMMTLSGTADSSKPTFQPPTSNIACPSKCIVANPSGVENTAYMADRQFNVLFRERGAGSNGSFWSENNPTDLTTLKAEIANLLQGTVANPGLRETYPFGGYHQNGNSSNYGDYYFNMNFYISLEDPAVDTAVAGHPAYRGFHYCANIDAIVNVVDQGVGTVDPANPSNVGTVPYGAVVGSFEGDVARWGPAQTGWGTPMRLVMIHEVFGHGVAGLTDEYVNTSGLGGVGFASLGSGFGIQPGMAPLTANACDAWCGSTQSLTWLKAEMIAEADPNTVCWGQPTSAACAGTGASCLWLGGAPPASPALAYWGSDQCIPATVAYYNIGGNCPAYGNHGCYPLAPYGTSLDVIADVAQPNSSIMQSTHALPAPGFSTVVENHIKDLMDCAFGPSPCGTTGSRCSNLFSSYGSSTTSPTLQYLSYLQSAAACQQTGLIHRRR